MQTVNFSLPVNLETGHPAFQLKGIWIGRADITQETGYDDNDQPFSVDVAWVTDLFFVVGSVADIKAAERVEIPDSSLNWYRLRYKLEQAAITAYHNPKLQPAEMPDEV